MDTGPTTLTAGRLLKAKDILRESRFFAHMEMVLPTLIIRSLIRKFESGSNQSLMTVYQPESRFGVVNFDSVFQVTSFEEKPKMAEWINIGYFAFQP